MKTVLCLLAFVGFALCVPQPEPQGFFEGLAAALGTGVGTVVGLARNLFGFNRRNATGGLFGDLIDAAGTLAVFNKSAKIEPAWSNSNLAPKKDGAPPKEGQKKARKKCKVKKKKDECPSRIRKTDRVILNSQARDIVAKVYDFMKKEALAKYAEKLTDARWRTATSIGISEKTVSRILSERNKKKAGSAAAGVGTAAVGKFRAAGDLGQAVRDAARFNISAVTRDIGDAAGSAIGGDLAGVGILATGVATAAGQIVGAKLHTVGQIGSTLGTVARDTIGGKIGAIQNVGAGVGNIAAGNATAALNSFGNAAASVIAGEAAGIGDLVNGTLSILGLGR